MLVAHSSFAPAEAAHGPDSTSALLLPSFTYLARLSTAPAALRSFIRAFLLPEHRNLHTLQQRLPESVREKMTRAEDPELRGSFDTYGVETPVVLVCGHGGRDRRCGVMGPLLEAEFRIALERAGFTVPGEGEFGVGDSEQSGDDGPTANVGLISHIGGHKFAGNVIVYIPSRYGLRDGQAGAGNNPLAGMGIWYGRVEPRHVEGIIFETIMRGRIIQELFRGGVGADGKVVRID